MPLIDNISIFGQKAPLKFGLVVSFGYFDFTPPDDIVNPHIVEDMLLLVIEQFESSQEMKNLFRDLLMPGQEVENLSLDMLALKDIYYASADRLDIIGAIVGESRSFKNDNDYRQAILSTIQVNKSFGQPEIIIDTLKILTKASHCIYEESYPAGVTLTFSTSYPLLPNLKQLIERVALAGVKINLQYINDDEPYFAFQSEGGFPDLHYTLGFSEINYLESGKEIGGRLVERIS